MIILIITLIKNNCIEFILMKSVRMLKLPMKPPKKSLLIEAFLLSKVETAVNKRKSKRKFKIKIKSKYIFILFTNISIKKQHNLLCRFVNLLDFNLFYKFLDNVITGFSIYLDYYFSSICTGCNCIVYTSIF